MNSDSFVEREKRHFSQRFGLPLSVIKIVSCPWLPGIEREILYEPGKKQPGAETRAIAAYLVQEEEYLSLTDLGNLTGRDLAALTRAAGRIREQVKENFELVDKIAWTREQLFEISKSQAWPPGITSLSY